MNYCKPLQNTMDNSIVIPSTIYSYQYKSLISEQRPNHNHIYLDDFQDEKYRYYQCYMDENRQFCYLESSPSNTSKTPNSLLLKINKNIPYCLHKPILYYYYIPKYRYR